MVTQPSKAGFRNIHRIDLFLKEKKMHTIITIHLSIDELYNDEQHLLLLGVAWCRSSKRSRAASCTVSAKGFTEAMVPRP